MIKNVPGSQLTVGPNPFQERVANPSLAKNLRVGQETKDKETEMKKASEGFEEIFARYLLNTMRQSVPKSSIFGKGFGADVYTSMFDEQIAKKITSTGKLG
ncbi:MAG: rod-binding protein, partial [Patescibacteria group bacterium]|nr:rod-binding protein [Patescibacteria group bacterium]